ncbi:cysteine desulfurase-like protein [Lactonifactor longoviformis]|uniref:cysteine desulfurase-like protein n=1 Tax=Lactonifactor longoviformis TaxID=341220 RepID=UPI0036F1F5AF
MNFKFDVNAVREQFPACKLEIDGVPIAYLDGPGGTQIPQRVLDGMFGYMVNDNANEDGNFKAGRMARGIEYAAREAAADLLGCDPDEIGFNCSSTQNNFNLAMNLSKNFQPGDELIVTEIDHRCNSAPWRSLERFGCVVKTVRLDPETQQLDFEDYKAKLSDKTRVVAVNWASNALGTVTDVKKFIKLAHEYGAFTVVDAVHYSAHFPIDVKDIDTDVLLCSPYKWFGPHMGVIYMKKEHIASLDFNNAKCDDISEGSRKFHMGTPQYESLKGITEAVNFIASIGEQYTECFAEQLGTLTGRRKAVVAGMLAIDEYESALAKKLRMGLRAIPGVKVWGPAEGQPRTPTVVFTVEGHAPEKVTEALGAKGINSWHGDFYAVEAVAAIGLAESGGLIRLGLAPYCTEGDIDRTLYTVREIVCGC